MSQWSIRLYPTNGREGRLVPGGGAQMFDLGGSTSYTCLTLAPIPSTVESFVTPPPTRVRMKHLQPHFAHVQEHLERVRDGYSYIPYPEAIYLGHQEGDHF